MSDKNIKKEKILLVDDDEFLIDMYSVKFKNAGYEIDTALNGKVALKKMEEDNYDVLLLDLLMPGVDGFEILENIKERNLKGNMNIIVLSNQSKVQDVEKAKFGDIDGYIVKASAVPSEVLDKVENIIKEKKIILWQKIKTNFLNS